MNADQSTIYAHVKKMNAAGMPVTYSTITKGKVLNRSGPTIFKITKEMVEAGTLKGEFIQSDTGHMHLCLFVSEGETVHTNNLIKMMITETKRMRLSMDGLMEALMSGKIVKPPKKDSPIWRRIEDFAEKLGDEGDNHGGSARGD